MTDHSTASRLRREFDEAFSRPARIDEPDRVELLAITIGRAAYAMPLADVAALRRGSKVVPLPTRVRALLGLIAIRGALAPVYDLAALLELGTIEEARWLVVLRGEAPIAVAVDGFDGHVRVASEAIVAAADGARSRLRGAVRDAGVLRPIVDVPSVVAALMRAAVGTQGEAGNDAR